MHHAGCNVDGRIASRPSRSRQRVLVNHALQHLLL
ncbi:Uncharacterised protein [Vibrio cholerae]|nr:Uncharacterised protein [Vibrio cholerae]